MADTNITDVIVKYKSRSEMSKEGLDLILKDRELIVETEGENETFIARFKIGDGKTPYCQLPYISSIYKLFPDFILYNQSYTYGIKINLKPIVNSEE